MNSNEHAIRPDLERPATIRLEAGYSGSKDWKLYAQVHVPREWFPRGSRRMGAQPACVVEFPTSQARWWLVLPFSTDPHYTQHDPLPLVGHWEHHARVRVSHNMYSRAQVTKSEGRIFWTIQRADMVKIAAAAHHLGLDPRWVGSRMTNRWFAGAVRNFPVQRIIQAWLPLGAQRLGN